MFGDMFKFDNEGTRMTPQSRSGVFILYCQLYRDLTHCFGCFDH